MANGKSKTHMSSDKSQATTSDQVSAIELNKIHVDYSWNSRAQRRVENDANAESSGFAGFVNGVRMSGQITPIILRNTNGRTLSGLKTDKPYEVVVGFRRYRAISLLNSKDETAKAKSEGRTVIPNLVNGTIRAEIRTIDNVIAARILNGQENTERENLRAPDQMFLVKELQHADMTQQVIADTLGITQGWVSKLAKVATLPPAVLSHWRDGTPIPQVTTKAGTFSIGEKDKTIELTEPQMRTLADLKEASPEDITARYISMAKPAPAQGEGPGTGETAKDKVLEEIVAVATLMACMVRAGVLCADSLDWNRVIGPRKDGYPLDCGKDRSQVRLIALGEAAQEAFDAELRKGSQPVKTQTAQA
jgi:hypothetical protein